MPRSTAKKKKKRQSSLDRDRHVLRENAHDYEGRDLGKAPASQGEPKIASKALEARERGMDWLLSLALQRNQLCQHLHLELIAPRTVRRIAIVQGPQFVVPCYSHPSNLVQTFYTSAVSQVLSERPIDAR